MTMSPELWDAARGWFRRGYKEQQEMTDDTTENWSCTRGETIGGTISPLETHDRAWKSQLRNWHDNFKSIDSSMNSPVNHPPHYTSHPSGIECIDITEHMSFCLGNVLKYVWRSDMKGNAVEDLEKARWYLDREIALRKKANRNPRPGP